MPHPATAAPARAMPGAERVPASCGASDALPRASPARPLAPWRPRKHPSSNCGPLLGQRARALRGALGARGAAGAWECFKDSPAAKAARGRVNSPPSTGMMPRSGQAGQMGACLLPASLPPPSREKAPKGRSRASSQGALWRRAGRGDRRGRGGMRRQKHSARPERRPPGGKSRKEMAAGGGRGPTCG